MRPVLVKLSRIILEIHMWLRLIAVHIFDFCCIQTPYFQLHGNSVTMCDSNRDVSLHDDNNLLNCIKFLI